jgi:hypothetical protein
MMRGLRARPCPHAPARKPRPSCCQSYCSCRREPSGAQGPAPTMWWASRGDPRQGGGPTTRSLQSLRPPERRGRSPPPPRRALRRLAGMCSGWCARRGVQIDNPAARGRRWVRPERRAAREEGMPVGVRAGDRKRERELAQAVERFVRRRVSFLGLLVYQHVSLVWLLARRPPRRGRRA